MAELQDAQATDINQGDSAPQVDSNEPAEQSTPRDDGPGSGRSQIRRDLEDGFERARKASEPPRREPRRPKMGGDRVGSRLDSMPESGAGAEPVAGRQAESGEEDVTPEVPPPEGWTPEAKGEWANTPDHVRAAILKREQDMDRGVKKLRDHYAEIDRALAPHLDAIRSYNQTPGKAVEQLFSWFDALAKNPAVAFPALARSFGHDINAFAHPVQQQQDQQQQRQPQPNQQGQQIQQSPQQVGTPGFNQRLYEQRQAQYIQQQLNQHLGPRDQKIEQLERLLYEANQRKTEENLTLWSKDKPYYEDVREDMAHMLNAAALANRTPTKDGMLDLDTVYNQAIWANDAVRNRMLQDQAASKRAADKAAKDLERKAQAEQADKARRAATSIPLTAPGLTPPAKDGGKRKSKSVRESLLEAKEYWDTQQGR